jgi:predicted NBD/HSP70 family sugar kinase
VGRTNASDIVDGGLGAGRPSLLRTINERSVLECIRGTGPISRAQLARACGLSKPTVSQALQALENYRLVRTAGRTSGGKGPTAILFEINPTAGWVVGIDVGHEYVRAAVADITGRVVTQRRQRTRARSAAAVIDAIGSVAATVVHDAGLSARKVTVTVVGSPGVFGDGAHPVLAHNLPGWERPGVLDAITEAIDTPVEFENDVNLAALGERWHGLGVGVDHFVYLHLGTGVGLGIVVDGELYRGAAGAAGEVGYLPLWGTDVRDAESRRRGPLDHAASADGVVRAAKRAGMTGSLTAAKVFEAAAQGETTARRVVRAEADRIALTIAAIAAVLDPELVILGGGIGANGDLLLDPVRDRLADVSPFQPRIEVSQLREEATLYGSVSMALAAAHEQLFDRTSASA